MSVVICFDIGIRNLAYCSYDSANKTILGWQNYDLINDSNVDSVKELYKCSYSCGKNALYVHDDKFYCTKHYIKPIFKDLSGNIIKKMPNVSVIKEILKVKKGTKEELYTIIKRDYSLPIDKKKKTIKKSFDMEALHDSIRKFVIDHKSVFSNANVIGLENQPVLINPVMKTVQVLLYATLRDTLAPSIPKMKLIHALKKVSDKQSGDKGYNDRKKASIERVNKFFKENASPKHNDMKLFFEASLKKADLADSFSMCLDYTF